MKQRNGWLSSRSSLPRPVKQKKTSILNVVVAVVFAVAVAAVGAVVVGVIVVDIKSTKMSNQNSLAAVFENV